ncbi:MAG: T9SS type A sorting domain-containing protein [Bacteroidota bacterium]
MRTFTFILALTISVSAFAQQGIAWQKTFGGSGHEYIQKTIPTSDGGFAFVGSSESTDGDVSGNHGQNDIWVAKATAAGAIQWSYLFGGTQDEEGFDLVQTADGGFFVCGWTDSFDGDVTGHHGTYSSDMWVLRLSASGTLMNSKCYGGTSDDEGIAITLTQDDNLYVAGTTYSYDGDVSGNHGTYQSDCWVIKMDTSLNLLAQKCIGGSDYEEGIDMKLTSDNGVVICGRSYSADGDATGYHAGSDMLVAKLTAAFSIEWAKCFGGSETEEGNSVVQLADNSYAVLGYTSTQNNGDVTGHHSPQGQDDFWLVKLNTNGTLNWAKCYGGSGDDQANGLVATLDGGYAMCGLTNSTDGDVTGFHSALFNPDFWVAKVNGSGTLQWQGCYGGNDQDESFRIYEESAGVFVVTGFTYSTDYDVTLNHGSADGWIIKVTGSNGIDDIGAAQFLVWPNPAFDYIYFDPDNLVSVNLFDVTGRNISIQKSVLSGKISVKDVPVGMYFLELVSENGRTVKPFVKN